MRSVVGKSKTMRYSYTQRVSSPGRPPSEYTVSNEYTYVPHSWTRSDIIKNVYRNGWRAPTNYASVKMVHQPLTYKVEWKGESITTHIVDDSMPYWTWGLPPLPSSDSSLQSLLVMKALASVKDEKINLAVALAEMGSTIDMIGKHASKFAKAFAFAKRGKWKQAYETLGVGFRYKQGTRDLASGWLELTYGWLPLLADIKGAIDEINRKVNAEGYTIVGRARSEKADTLTATRRGFYRYSLPVNVTTEVWLKTTQKVALWYRLDMPNLKRASSVGVTNPFSILWELTLFSFLVDWWASVGDWLSSLDATIGLTYMGGTHTFYCEQTADRQSLASVKGGKTQYTSGSYSIKTMDRKVISDRPDKALVFTNPLSTSHAITAVALTITSLKTR